MDPEEALRQLRVFAGEVINMRSDDLEDDDPRSNELALAESFIALDEWLCKGGFLPAAWAPRDSEGRQWVLGLANYEMDRTDENNHAPTAGDYLVDTVRFLARQLPHDDPAHNKDDCLLDDEHHGFPEGMPGA